MPTQHLVGPQGWLASRPEVNQHAGDQRTVGLDGNAIWVGAQQVLAAQHVLEESEEDFDHPSIAVDRAMISAGGSSKLVAMSNWPLLAGPAVLPLRPPRFSCGCTATTTRRTGWYGRLFALEPIPRHTTASCTTPAARAASDNGRSLTTSKLLLSRIR